jgi:hypothetical protein
MECPQCQFENREAVKFCEELGMDFWLKKTKEIMQQL